MIDAPLSLSHSTRKPRAWQELLAVSALFALLTLIYFWPQLVQKRALYWGDISLYFLPMASFLRENLAAGRLPLWNPWLLCGTPFVGNPQAWPLYPISALLPFVSASSFLSVTIAFHVWLAALGMYLFLRRAVALNRTSSSLGAVLFAFGGQLVSKEQFPNMVQATAWLPWILAAADTLLRKSRTVDAVWLGVLLGLQLLAAHIQITLLTLYLTFAYCASQCGLVRSRAPQRGSLRLRRLVPQAALSGLIACGLSAGQVLPTIELYRDAWRQKLSFYVVNRFYLPANQLGNFVFPRLHGHPYFGNFNTRGNFWETCCYVGVLGAALAACGGFLAWRKSELKPMRFWAGLFVFGTWMAAGGPGKLYHLAYLALPGFRSFHDPARCLLWSAFAVSVLAAAGLQFLMARFGRTRSSWVVSALAVTLVFGDLAHFGRTIYPLLAPAQTVSPGPAVLHLLDAGKQTYQERLMAPDSARVWQRFTSHRAYRQNVPKYPRDWADTLTPNIALSYGARDAYGYEPLTRLDAQLGTGTAVALLRPEATPAQRQAAAVWAGMLGVRTLAFFRTVPPDATIPNLTPLISVSAMPPFGQAGSTALLYFTQNKKWQPRARLTTRFVGAADRPAAFRQMLQSINAPASFDMDKTTVIVGSAGFASSAQASGQALPQAFITSDSPDRVVVSARTAAPALLVLADTLHPGWGATVDSRAVSILSADGFLRAVPLLKPGAHRVVFQYRPTSFLLGLYLMLLTTAGVLGFCLAFTGKEIAKERNISALRQDFA